MNIKYLNWKSDSFYFLNSIFSLTLSRASVQWTACRTLSTTTANKSPNVSKPNIENILTIKRLIDYTDLLMHVWWLVQSILKNGQISYFDVNDDIRFQSKRNTLLETTGQNNFWHIQYFSIKSLQLDKSSFVHEKNTSLSLKRSQC